MDLERHFWLLILLANCVNAAVLHFRGLRNSKTKPELSEGYGKLVRGYLIWMNFPWVVMGLGILTGEAPTFRDYLNLRAGNPYVTLFVSVVVAEWLLGLRWIFFRGGAEMLVSHPGLFNRDFTKPYQVKLMYSLCVLGGIFALAALYYGPRFIK